MSPLSASSLHSGDEERKLLMNTICSSYFPESYRILPSNPLYRYFIRVDNATNACSRSLAPVKDIVLSLILLGIGRWRGVINLKSDAFE